MQMINIPLHRAASDASIRNGKIGIGFIIKTPDKKEVIFTYSQEILFSDFTPNSIDHAEIMALTMCLEKLLELGINRVKMRSDSKNIEGYLRNRRKPNKDILSYVLKVKALISQFDRVRVKWIPREFNVEADILSKVCTA